MEGKVAFDEWLHAGGQKISRSSRPACAIIIVGKNLGVAERTSMRVGPDITKARQL
jgi:hypothetical protein